MKRKFSSHIGVLTVIVVSMLGTAIAHAATTKPAKPDGELRAAKSAPNMTRSLALAKLPTNKLCFIKWPFL